MKISNKLLRSGLAMLAASAIWGGHSAHASYSFTSTTLTITENFADWNGSAAPSNWILNGFNNGSNSTINTSQAGAQSPNFKGAIAVGAANSGGGFESRGSVNPPGNARSLSYLANGSNQNAQMIAVFQNNTGGTITSLSIDYTASQWYTGGTRDSSLVLQYSLNGTSWTNAGSSWDAPVTTGGNNAVNGLAAGNNQSFTDVEIDSLSINNGETFYVRWLYLGGLNGAGARQTLGISDLSFTATFSSSGAKDLVWNTGSTWATGGAGFVEGANPENFSAGDSVTFGDTNVGIVNITGTVEPATTTISNTTGTYTFQGGSIGGGGTLTKENAGTAILADSNSFTGAVNINGGILQANSDSALGGGSAVNFDGGTLRAGGDITGTRTLTANAGGATVDTNGFDVSVASIGGTGAFTKSGGGTLTTDGYAGSGALSVSAGTLQIDGSATTLISSGGSIEGTLALGGGVRYNFADGTLGGSGQINVLADGTSIATTSSPDAVINPGIVLNSNNVAGPFQTNIGAVSGSTMTINGTISGASDVRFSAGSSGGAGILTLNSANTYTGMTEINNAQSGVVRLGVENALPTTTGVTWGITQNSGSIDLNGFDQTLTYIATTANVTGGIANTGAAATLTLNQDIDTTFGAVIGQVSNVTNLPGWNNDISLVKNGTGELTLTGVNTYTGSTTVNAGTLVISGGGSIASSSEIIVASGASLDLSAIGGMTIADGASIGGGGVVIGDLNFADGANFVFSLNNPLTVNGGTVTFDNFGFANLIGFDATVGVGSYNLIVGSATIDFNNISNFGFDNRLNIGDGKFAYFDQGSLMLVVIPEPSTWILVMIGLSVFIIRRKLRALEA